MSIEFIFSYVIGLGPLGIQFICEKMMQLVGDRVDEIKSLVLQNRSILESLRECFNDPVRTHQLNAKLQNSDHLLVLLKEIGIVLAFRMLCMDALNQVMEVGYFSVLILKYFG